jgi:hypothetical protein
MLHQVKSAVIPFIGITLIISTAVLVRFGLALHALR